MSNRLRVIRNLFPNSRPRPDDLAEGQIGINVAAETPQLFIKDALGGIVKIGPIHVGPTAPNAVPNVHPGNSLGESWLDTSGGGRVLKIWDSTAWVSISSGGPSGGDFVAKTGDQMGGTLANSAKGEWAFVGNSNLGVNESGLFCDSRGNYILALRDSASGAITATINSLGDAQFAAAQLTDLAGPDAAPLWVDASGVLVRGTGPGVGDYVAKTGDTMSGALVNITPTGWVFRAATDLGVNDSGLYATGDGNYIFSVRDKDGNITFDANSEAGLVQARSYLAMAEPDSWAYVFASKPGVNESGFFVNSDGDHVLSLRDGDGKIIFNADASTGLVEAQNYVSYVPEGWAFAAANDDGNVNISGLFSETDGSYTFALRRNDGTVMAQFDSRNGGGLLRGPLECNSLLVDGLIGIGVEVATLDSRGQLARSGAKLGDFVAKTGDQISGTLSSSAKDAWVFVGNSSPGVNESGLFCDAQGNYVLGLRDNSGDITVAINSFGDATLNALMLRDLADLDAAPLWVNKDGVVIRGTNPGVGDYVAKTGDTMSGALNSNVANGWIFRSATNLGVNDSGLFALGDGNVLFNLKDSTGDTSFDVSSENGWVQASQYISFSDKDNWAYFFASQPGVNDSGFFVDKDGDHFCALRAQDGSIVFAANAKEAIVQCAEYQALSEFGRWAYVFASIEGVNNSGFFVDDEGNHLMTLRDVDGDIVLDANTKTGEVLAKGVVALAESGRWAFRFASIPNVNESGFFVGPDGDHILSLRDNEGDIVFNADATTGIVQASNYVSYTSDNWAFAAAKDKDNLNISGLFSNADGSYTFSMRRGDGDVMAQIDSAFGNAVFSGTAQASQVVCRAIDEQWGFVATSVAGEVNASGLFATKGSFLFGLRNQAGVVTADIDGSSGHARFTSLEVGGVAVIPNSINFDLLPDAP